jgi:predicted membrane metal-binding protein
MLLLLTVAGLSFLAGACLVLVGLWWTLHDHERKLQARRQETLRSVTTAWAKEKKEQQ